MTDGRVSAERLEELRMAQLGPVLVPGDPAYDETRKVWNGMFDRRPAVIAQCMGVADVQAAVGFARANGLVVAVRGGGHSCSGASTTEGGMLIDLGLMRGVHVDPDRRVAVAAAGTLLAELDRETQVHGLAVTAGTISHTGIAGLTLGGGAGRLMRKYGLTCDSVLGFDVVTADGRWLHADAESHADLYWALRGGGGTFGIVTHFEYQLHPLSPIVYGGFLGWPLAQAKEAFRHVHAHLVDAPDDVQVQLIFVTGPEIDFIPDSLRGQPALLMTVTWVGEDLDAGERYVAPLREGAVPPTLDLVGRFPYTFLQAGADPLAPHGRRSCASMSGYFADLSDEIVDAAIAQAERFPTPYSVIELSQMGGAVARVPADAMATPLLRDAGYFYITGANCIEEADVQACRDWTFEADTALRPFALPGRYINFVSEDDDEGMRASIGERAFERLLSIKAAYDPDGVFSYNPNRRVAI